MITYPGTRTRCPHGQPDTIVWTPKARHSRRNDPLDDKPTHGRQSHFWQDQGCYVFHYTNSASAKLGIRTRLASPPCGWSPDAPIRRRSAVIKINPTPPNGSARSRVQEKMNLAEWDLRRGRRIDSRPPHGHYDRKRRAPSCNSEGPPSGSRDKLQTEEVCWTTSKRRATTFWYDHQ